MKDMTANEWFGKKKPEAKGVPVTPGGLWQHQVQAVERSQKVEHLGLFWEMGTGKTRATIDILRHRYTAHKRLMRTLVLSPKITLTNWKREIAKYSKIHPRDVVILTGSASKRMQTFIKECTDNHILCRPKIVIMNYEGLQMTKLFSLLKDWNPEILVGDEIHRIKNPESKRAKLAIQLADNAKYRYALTGTPILNTAMDIFNIFRFLDKGAAFGQSFYKFRSIWFEDENAGWQGKQGYFPKFIPRPETYFEFNKKIQDNAIRVVKSECLDLPPFIRKEVFVELGPEQKRLYDEMKKEFIAYIDDVLKTDTPRAVVAQMAVTKSLRLMQIVTGYAKTDEGEIYKIKKNPRIDALRELLEDHAENHKIIIWSVFHENYADIAALCKELKIKYTELHGQISNQKQRDKNIDDFNNDPTVRVMIANQAAGGIGINLVPSDISIFYSKGYSLEQDLQAEARNYRGGSEMHKSVTRIDIVAEDTIDELITDVLFNKMEIGTKILDWGKQ